MLNPLNLGAGRQEVIEVASPSGRVFSEAIAAGRRPVEHAFDPTPDPAGRLRLRGPDRFQHLHDKPDVDRLHRQLADRRVGEGGQRLPPLRLLLAAPPAGRVCVDIALGRLP